MVSEGRNIWTFSVITTQAEKKREHFRTTCMESAHRSHRRQSGFTASWDRTRVL